MEAIIVVEKILTPYQFTKKDGTIGVRNSFVGKTNFGRFDKLLKFDVISQENWAMMGIAIGKTYKVWFDAESRFWNNPTKGEQWFTSLTCWKAELQTQQVSQPAVQQVAQTNVQNNAQPTTPQQVDDERLPF